MISVQRLINDLRALDIDHEEARVWLQVDTGGMSHRLPLGSMQFGAGGLTLSLVGEPEPVQDPVIKVPAQNRVEDDHTHEWQRDDVTETWRCVLLDCEARVTFEQISHHPIPADSAEGIALLNHLA